MSYVFIIGTGGCGMGEVARRLNKHPDVNIRLGMQPILPWDVREEALRDRISELAELDGVVTGDVGWSYLPYLLELSNTMTEALRIIHIWAPFRKDAYLQTSMRLPGMPWFNDADDWTAYWEMYMEATSLLDTDPQCESIRLEHLDNPDILNETYKFLGVEGGSLSRT